ncbi:MAG: RNA polymerase sigma factor [Desulfopila sp.]
MDKFRVFYLENGGRLFNYLLRKSCNPHVASDLVQESFTRYLEKYSNRELSLALLFTIGRNLFYDHIRLQKRDVTVDIEPVSPQADQEARFVEKEDVRRVLEAMQQLSAEERDILALVVSGGLSYAEIAAIHHCSETNIKVKVHRARKKLRQLLR